MKIINNISNNHFNALDNVVKQGDELFLVSPFLMESFSEFFEKISRSNVKKITLVTTLKENSIDMINKADELFSFCFGCIENQIEWKILIDNKLHGKIYISLREGRAQLGMVCKRA